MKIKYEFANETIEIEVEEEWADMPVLGIKWKRFLSMRLLPTAIFIWLPPYSQR